MKKSSLSLAVALCFAGVPALAAEVEKPPANHIENSLAEKKVVTGELDEITVTGQVTSGVTEGTGNYTTIAPVTDASGLKLTLRETPQSITVMTHQAMVDQNLTNLMKVMDRIPGIATTAWGSETSVMNGFTSRGDYGISYRLDGVPTRTAFSNMGMLDTAIYDRITALRGSTGLLTGSGSPGASINLSRKRPTKYFQANVNAAVGRWDRYRTVADISGPLYGDGTLRGRLVVSHEDNKSWMEFAKFNKSTVYGVVETDLSANTIARVGFEFGRMRAHRYGMHGARVATEDGQATAFNGFRNPYAKWSYNNYDRRNAFISLEHKFSNAWQVNANLSYGSAVVHELSSSVRFTTDDPNYNRMSTWLYNQSTRDTVVDLMLTGPYHLFGREHELVAGFNYGKERGVGNWHGDHQGGIYNLHNWDGTAKYPVFKNPPRPKVNTAQIGIYSATRLNLSDRLNVIGGARISNYKKATSDLDEKGVITPYAAITFDINHILTTYISYTDIFEAQSAQDVNGKTLNPEVGRNYEVGVKAAFFDGRLNASANIFEAKMDNIAVADDDNKTPEGDQAYKAIDNTKNRGLEFDINGEITPNWKIAAGYTGTLFKDSEGIVGRTGSPRHRFKLFTSYQFDGKLNGLTIGSGINWRNRVYNDSTYLSKGARPYYQRGSFALVDFMARYQFNKNLSLIFNLENAFDKRYRVRIQQHNLGTPRNFTATVNYKFR